MSEYDFKGPFEYKSGVKLDRSSAPSLPPDIGPSLRSGWYIFPETTLSDIRVDDCVASVTGKCEITNTLEDCIKLTEEYPDSYVGYYIETPDKKNICVPIKKIPGGPSIGPYYRLRSQKIYPEMTNVKSTVFVNKIYPFPPDHTNCVFFTDRFILTSVLGSTPKIKPDFIGIKDQGKGVTKVTWGDTPLQLQFLPDEITRTYISKFLIIRSGDNIVVSIPGTSYVLRYGSQGLSWSMRVNTLQGVNNSFQVHAVGKKDGEFVTFSDEIFLKNSGRYVGRRDTDSFLDLVDSDSKVTLKFTPKVQGYYCKGGKCTPVKLEEGEGKGLELFKDGNIIHRNPNCWKICEKIKNKGEELSFPQFIHKKSKKVVFWVFIAIFLIIFLLLFLLLRQRWRLKH